MPNPSRIMNRLLTFLFTIAVTSAFAQGKLRADSPEYQEMKAQGKLPRNYSPAPAIVKDGKNVFPAQTSKTGIDHLPITQSTGCDCMIPLDNTFSIVPMSGGTPPEYRNDDLSSAAIPLQFNFCFYGQTITSVYINNNGNISFGSPYGTFTATGFPSNQFSMVAPFWADVDTRNPTSGVVHYKSTPTAFIVKWEQVGYFNSYADKVNTFQLIITDGSDPLIPGGNNVSFCYGDMQWTTGDASGGSNGFGGSPATVGANLGNGVDYIQFGQFDSPGGAYSGPFPSGPPYEGIDWLDYKSFVFNTCNNNNIAPIPSGIAACDTIQICEGDTLNFNVQFLSPEVNQTTTATVSAPGVNGFNVISNTPGNNAVIIAQLIANSANYGYNTITFSGTDNGTPAQTTTVTLVIQVDTFVAPDPVITGPNVYCQGGNPISLDAGPGYTSYNWNTGATTQTLSNVTQGVYTVTVAYNGCSKTSPPFTVTELPAPVPVITGVLNTCGSDNALLSADSAAFASYVWSTGSTDPFISVPNGTYTVTVTDTNGCIGVSAPITVNQSPKPVAAFTSQPLTTSFPNDSIHFMDQSTVSSGSISSWLWTFGDNNSSMLQNPAHAYPDPGTYNVCLVVATAAGCSDTICKTYEVVPLTVLAPNVFTPNGDGKNETLKFENLEFYPNNYLTVFNRWGNVVHEASGYNNDWTGKGVSDGVYFFILELPGLGTTLKGHVEILR